MTSPFAEPATVTVRVFTQRFSSTPRGARLARLLALQQLHHWDIPYGSPLSDDAALIVSELVTNAATHGRLRGRDFELHLAHPTGLLVIEVSDARGEHRPSLVKELHGDVEEHGRGLLLVDALADRWSVRDRSPSGKTVRAEVDLPSTPRQCPMQHCRV